MQISITLKRTMLILLDCVILITAQGKIQNGRMVALFGSGTFFVSIKNKDDMCHVETSKENTEVVLIHSAPLPIFLAIQFPTRNCQRKSVMC
ncbi:hypothetical protein ACH33_17070 [Aneurinibacillus sp. XH2]|nr:hypothetical protein ACH33_17070 [Aneurinibacillus sp. XH2]